MKRELLALIKEIPTIEGKFRIFEPSAGMCIPSGEFIYDNPDFIEWKENKEPLIDGGGVNAMANFNEHALEMSIMELFKDEGYTYVSGDQIHRERTEVLLTDDLKQYLYNRYAKDGITPSEVDSVILMLRNISGTIYEANKAVFKLLCDGFILNREDRTQKDLYIELIDFDTRSSSEKFSGEDKDYIHFYCAVRSILFKLTKGDAPDMAQMNARVREMLEGAIQSDGIEELFETGKHISVDIFSDEYMNKINAIQLPNTKIKILQRLLSQAIDEYKKVNKIMGVEFADRLKKVVDEYNNRRRDEAYANEVLDDVAEQLAQLLSELKTEKNSFKNMGIDYEEKAFYDILKAVAKKFEFEYPDDKMIELSKRIKLIVDDKSRYTDWSARDDIKANLQVDLILLLDEFDYPPVTIDDVYKEVLEQAENFKKYAK